MLLLDFINVGYGDSILVRVQEEDGTQFSMLVDAGDVSTGHGGDRGVFRISALEYLNNLCVEALDLLVVTHLHKDHTGGLLALARAFPVRRILTLYQPPTDICAAPAAGAVAYAPGPRALAEAADIYVKALALMKGGGAKVEDAAVLPPEFVLAGTLRAKRFLADGVLLARQKEILDALLRNGSLPEYESALRELDGVINNLSMVLLLEYAGRKILLPGDAYATFWQPQPAPECDILKLAHHGHSDAISNELARAFSPEYVVVSVSDDREDDCPSQRAIAAFGTADSGPRVLYTDHVAVEGVHCEEGHSAVRFSISSGGVVVCHN